MTQGDVVRNMTNEQLARLFAEVYINGMLDALQNGHVTCTYEENQKRWQEWMNYEMMVEVEE